MSSSSAAKSSKLPHHGLKKGPWTTAEDMLLVEYVKKHGEGNWNAVQRHSGLMRCGKSCRLRWANHLRPNLKKGAFSAEEENTIADLHAKMGNKWARMAAQLPGRTDNEIKNYWNTRLKRRQRAGLPIYPQEVVHHHQDNSSPPSPSSLLVVSSAHNPAPNPSRFHLFNTFSSPYNTNHHQLKLDPGNNGLSLDHNPSSYPSAMAGPFLYQAGLENDQVFYHQYNSGPGFGIITSSNTGLLGLPSIQSPAASSSDFLMANSSDVDYEVAGPGNGRRNNSGLLEDLLGESQALANSGAQKHVDEGPFVAAGDGKLHDRAAFGFGNGIGNDSSANNYEGEETRAPGPGNSLVVDDDLLNLLDSFPLCVPIPNWDEENGGESPIVTNGTNAAVGRLPDNLGAASSRPANQDWNFGSCLWNNMPSIY